VTKGKKSKVVRSRDALKFVKLANTDPDRKDAAMLFARILEFFGRYNEDRGYHAHRPKGTSRYAEDDRAAMTWMMAEHERTQDGPYALAGRYLDAHPNHPGQGRPATGRRLGGKFKRLLRERSRP
jgi:hypothetical protein